MATRRRPTGWNRWACRLRSALLTVLAILAGCSHAPSAGSPGTTVSTPLRPGGTPINTRQEIYMDGYYFFGSLVYSFGR